MTKSITVLYFAHIRDASGVSKEAITTERGTAGEVYHDLSLKYGFPYDTATIRVAINQVFATWESPVADGDTVALLAPFAGG